MRVESGPGAGIWSFCERNRGEMGGKRQKQVTQVKQGRRETGDGGTRWEQRAGSRGAAGRGVYGCASRVEEPAVLVAVGKVAVQTRPAVSAVGPDLGRRG